MSKKTKYLVVDESVFDKKPYNPAHNRRIWNFLRQAAGEFTVCIGFRENDNSVLSEHAQRLNIFGETERQDADLVHLNTWQFLREQKIDVIISDRNAHYNCVKAGYRGNSPVIPEGKEAFRTFMKVYGRDLHSPGEVDECAAEAEEWQRAFLEKDRHLHRMYDDPRAVWKKIQTAPEVRSLMYRFNRQAPGNTELQGRLYDYFTTLALDIPSETGLLRKYRQNMKSLIQENAPELQCMERLGPALSLIRGIIKKEPRNELALIC